MQQGMVSIVVPVYNVAEYLQDCVDSLLAQTYPLLEVILVSDASNDGSAALCDVIAAADGRVKVFHQAENKGVSAARNCGIAAAQGEYFFFADADDTLNPDGIAFLVALLQQNPACDVAACGYYINGVAQAEPNATPLVWQREAAITAMFDYSTSVVKGVLWNKLFRQSVVVAHGLRFDEDAYICEDSLFCLQYLLASAAGSMAYDSVPQYRYIRRSGSAMHSRLTARRVSVLPTYQKIMQLVAPLGMTALSETLKINYLNHHLHLLQVTWKTRDAETMQAAGAVYRSFRPYLGWFLRQKNARAKRKLIAMYFYFTAVFFPKG